MFAGHHAGSPYHRVTEGLTVNWPVAKDVLNHRPISIHRDSNSASGFWQWDHAGVEVTQAAIHPVQEVIWNRYKPWLILICVLLTLADKV